MENPAPRSFDFSHVVVHRINAFPFLIPAQYGDRLGYRTDNAHIIEPTWKSRTALHNGFIPSNPHYSIATTRCIEDSLSWRSALLTSEINWIPAPAHHNRIEWSEIWMGDTLDYGESSTKVL